MFGLIVAKQDLEILFYGSVFTALSEVSNSHYPCWEARKFLQIHLHGNLILSSGFLGNQYIHGRLADQHIHMYINTNKYILNVFI